MIDLTLGLICIRRDLTRRIFFLTAALQLYHSHSSIHSSSRPPAFHLTQFHLLSFTVKIRPRPTSTSTAVVALEQDLAGFSHTALDLLKLWQTHKNTFFFSPFWLRHRLYFAILSAVENQHKIATDWIRAVGLHLISVPTLTHSGFRNRSQDDAIGWNVSLLTHLASSVRFCPGASSPDTQTPTRKCHFNATFLL